LIFRNSRASGAAAAETSIRNARPEMAAKVMVVFDPNQSSCCPRAFCAGLDVERIAAVAQGSSLLPFADLAQRTHGMANYAQHIVWLWRELPVPVIAAVHGVAVGGGFQLTPSAPICATSRRASGDPLRS
jgi:1,4-dihydroxy-2-naphthoyl-CoA synthase